MKTGVLGLNNRIIRTIMVIFRQVVVIYLVTGNKATDPGNNNIALEFCPNKQLCYNY
jgi:hypothetical protein